MAEKELDPKDIVLRIIKHASESRSSDIHIQISPPVADILLRIDGVLQKSETITHTDIMRLGNRIMFLAGLKTYKNDIPQEGRIKGEEVGIDGYIRVSCYPTVSGLRIALRLLRDNTHIATLDNLCFPEYALRNINYFLSNPGGAMLLTGPSGSGKTTTIYACLKKLQETGTSHIVTIEDPVEFKLPGIMQTQIRQEVGLDFAEALKKLLRQDPEVIVIGEIRDKDTAKTAFQASLTGHKVISTIHAGTAVEVLVRLIEIGLDPSIIASSLALVVAQRLLRRVCGSCKGNGCDECGTTGYFDRIPAVETLQIGSKLRKNIANDFDEDTIREIVETDTFINLRKCAEQLHNRGLTTEDEIQRVIGT